MTSTNDGKDVKSNQSCGQKGKTYYIELYKTLDSQLTGEGDIRNRTRHLCEAWRRVHCLCLHSAATTHVHLLGWLQKHTARVILQTEWQSPSCKDAHTSLENALNDLIEECKSATAKRDGVSPSWEQQLQQRAEWFKRNLENPWGHPVLKVLLDPRGQRPTDDEILTWLKEERGVMFVTRLRQLATSKCDDLAMALVTAVMDRVRATMLLVLDNEQEEKDKPAESKGEPTFADILKTDADFTSDVWDLLTDIEFVLLHKSDRVSKCIELAKQTPLCKGYPLVERLQARLETSPREKKLWKNAKEVAILIAQVIIARCMLVPVCVGTAGKSLYWCARALARLLPSNRLPAAAATLAAPAATARHLHMLASAVDTQCSADMKPFVCELYVRAITAGMNELERFKLTTEKESEARSTEKTLCTWFTQLGILLSASDRIKCECTLTAFSVHPSPTMYEKIKSAPILPPVAVPDDHDVKQESTSEFGSWATDSNTHSNLVKTSETLNIKHTQNQANVLSTAILTEGEGLGLSPELCQDIAVLLSGPRVKTLSWDMDRELLLENCRTYMERTHGGTKALTTELKYLNLDPRSYQHLPLEEEDENDVYYGIEKGYEHLVELQEQEEVIWDTAIFDPEMTESCPSDIEYELCKMARKKKNKKVVNSTDEEETDPLSMVAENKKNDKKKERPHSKERSSKDSASKEKKERKKKTKSKEDSQENKDRSRERRKSPETKAKTEAPNKEKKKEKKPRKKKIKEEKQQAPIDSKPGSLSSLIGMKVAKIKIPEGKYKKTESKVTPCITDSDYDSQGKSSLASLNSEGNDPDVVFDGLFSMDEYKSPDKNDPPSKRNSFSSGEVSFANGQVAVHSQHPYKQYDVKPTLPQNRDASPSQTLGSSANKGSSETIREEVKKSLSKLLEYRRQKNLLNEAQKVLNYSASSQNNSPPKTPNTSNSRFTGSIYQKPNPEQTITCPKAMEHLDAHKVYMNKKGMELSDLKTEVDNYLKTKFSPKPVIQYASKQNVDNTLQNNTPASRHEHIQPSSYQDANIAQTNQQINIAGVNYPLQLPHTSSVSQNQRHQTLIDSSGQKNFQDFLRELQETINAGTGANGNKTKKQSAKKIKSEIKPMSRVSPIIPNAINKETSSQSAKTLQGKRVETQLNTFSRLSYMHKNKQNSESVISQYDQNLINRYIEEQRLAKSKHIQSKCERKFFQSKNDMVLSKSNTAHSAASNDSKHSVIHITEKPSSLALGHTLLSTLIQKQDSTGRQMNSGDLFKHQTLPPDRTKESLKTYSKNTALSDRDQNDLLLLLRQQSKLNTHVPTVTGIDAYNVNNVVSNSQCSTSNMAHTSTSTKPQKTMNSTLVKSHPVETYSKTCNSSIGKYEDSGSINSTYSCIVNKPTTSSNPTLLKNHPLEARPKTSHSKFEGCKIKTMYDVPKEAYTKIVDCKTSKVKTILNKGVNVTPNISNVMNTLHQFNEQASMKKNNLPSNTSETLGTSRQDWEQVMDAILSHKTPSRGPNALDMVLKKSSFSDLRNQRIVRPATAPILNVQKEQKNTSVIEKQNSQVVKAPAPTQQANLNLEMIQQSFMTSEKIKKGSTVASPRVVITKVQNCNKPESTKHKRAQKITISTQNAPSTSESCKVSEISNKQTSHPEIELRSLLHHVKAETSLIQDVKKSTRDERNTRAVVDTTKKQCTKGLHKEKDPFISGIPNSDYDLLEELMDDELRKEIGELSSDEEVYQAPVTGIVRGAKIISINCKSNTVKETFTQSLRDTIIKSNKPQALKCLKNSKPENITKPSTSASNIVNVSNSKPKLIRSNNVICPANISHQSSNVTSILNTEPPPLVPTNSINVVETSNVIIATVPQPAIQNVVLIGSDLVFDPYLAMQSQIQSGICTVNQGSAYGAFSKLPNITVYQTTQFAAPVVNPVIIGNAMTMPMSNVSHNIEKSSKSDSNGFKKSDLEQQTQNKIQPMKQESKADICKLEQLSKGLEQQDLNIKGKHLEQIIDDKELKRENASFHDELNLDKSKELKSKTIDQLVNGLNGELEKVLNSVGCQSNEDFKQASQKTVEICSNTQGNEELKQKVPAAGIDILDQLKQRETNKTLDINLNKICERKVLSEVQEKLKIVHKTDNLKSKNKQIVVFNNVKEKQKETICVTSEVKSHKENEKENAKNVERLQNKRLAIINREITHRSNYPPIPLSYVPLTHNTPNTAVIATETRQSAGIKIKRKINEETVVNNENTLDKQDRHQKNKLKENNNNSTQCRRILLRSSNELKVNIDKPLPAETVTVKKDTVKSIKIRIKVPPKEHVLVDDFIVQGDSSKQEIKQSKRIKVSKNKLTSKKKDKTVSAVVSTKKKKAKILTNEDNSSIDVINIEDIIPASSILKTTNIPIESKIIPETTSSINDIKNGEKVIHDEQRNIAKSSQVDAQDFDNKAAALKLTKNINSAQKSKNNDTIVPEKLAKLQNPNKRHITRNLSYDMDLNESPLDSLPEKLSLIEKSTDKSDFIAVKKNTSVAKNEVKLNAMQNKNLANEQNTTYDETVPDTPTTSETTLQHKTSQPNLNIQHLQNNNKQFQSSTERQSSNTEVLNKKQSQLPNEKLNSKSEITAISKPNSQAAHDESFDLMSLEKDVKIEELPPIDNEPNKKRLRIILPNGKVFKATVFGQIYVSFQSLFADPSLKTALMNNLCDNKRYTLNVKQISTMAKHDPSQVFHSRIEEISFLEKSPTKPVETVNLLSDDEDVPIENDKHNFKTEFGIYKVSMLDTKNFERHQNRFDLKSVVVLNRIDTPNNITDVKCNKSGIVENSPTNYVSVDCEKILKNAHLNLFVNESKVTCKSPITLQDNSVIPSVSNNEEPLNLNVIVNECEVTRNSPIVLQDNSVLAPSGVTNENEVIEIDKEISKSANTLQDDGILVAPSELSNKNEVIEIDKETCCPIASQGALAPTELSNENAAIGFDEVTQNSPIALQDNSLLDPSELSNMIEVIKIDKVIFCPNASQDNGVLAAFELSNENAVTGFDEVTQNTSIALQDNNVLAPSELNNKIEVIKIDKLTYNSQISSQDDGELVHSELYNKNAVIGFDEVRQNNVIALQDNSVLDPSELSNKNEVIEFDKISCNRPINLKDNTVLTPSGSSDENKVIEIDEVTCNNSPIILQNNSESTPSGLSNENEVIEIDDSSNDSVNLIDKYNLITKQLEKIVSGNTATSIVKDNNPLEKIIELKHLLLQDLGVKDIETTVDDIPLSPIDEENVKNKNVACVSECYVKLTRCDDIVKKYEHLKIMKRKCTVDLFRCDHMITVANEDHSEELESVNSDSDELIDIGFEESNLPTPSELSRCNSFSLLNDFAFYKEETPNEFLSISNTSYDEERTSPVIDVYDTIVAFKNYLRAMPENNQSKTCNIKCYSEWLNTKHDIHIESKTHYPSNDSEVSISSNVLMNNKLPSLKTLTANVFKCNNAILDRYVNFNKTITSSPSHRLKRKIKNIEANNDMNIKYSRVKLSNLNAEFGVDNCIVSKICNLNESKVCNNQKENNHSESADNCENILERKSIINCSASKLNDTSNNEKSIEIINNDNSPTVSDQSIPSTNDTFDILHKMDDNDNANECIIKRSVGIKHNTNNEKLTDLIKSDESQIISDHSNTSTSNDNLDILNKTAAYDSIYNANECVDQSMDTDTKSITTYPRSREENINENLDILTTEAIDSLTSDTNKIYYKVLCESVNRDTGNETSCNIDTYDTATEAISEYPSDTNKEHCKVLLESVNLDAGNEISRNVVPYVIATQVIGSIALETNKENCKKLCQSVSLDVLNEISFNTNTYDVVTEDISNLTSDINKDSESLCESANRNADTYDAVTEAFSDFPSDTTNDCKNVYQYANQDAVNKTFYIDDMCDIATEGVGNFTSDTNKEDCEIICESMNLAGLNKISCDADKHDVTKDVGNFTPDMNKLCESVCQSVKLVAVKETFCNADTCNVATEAVGKFTSETNKEDCKIICETMNLDVANEMSCYADITDVVIKPICNFTSETNKKDCKNVCESINLDDVNEISCNTYLYDVDENPLSNIETSKVNTSFPFNSMCEIISSKKITDDCNYSIGGINRVAETENTFNNNDSNSNIEDRDLPSNVDNKTNDIDTKTSSDNNNVNFCNDVFDSELISNELENKMEIDNRSSCAVSNEPNELIVKVDTDANSSNTQDICDSNEEELFVDTTINFHSKNVYNSITTNDGEGHNIHKKDTFQNTGNVNVDSNVDDHLNYDDLPISNEDSIIPSDKIYYDDNIIEVEIDDRTLSKEGDVNAGNLLKCESKLISHHIGDDEYDSDVESKNEYELALNIVSSKIFDHVYVLKNEAIGYDYNNQHPVNELNEVDDKITLQHQDTLVDIKIRSEESMTASVQDSSKSHLRKEVTLVYKDGTDIVLKGIEYEDPVVGTCYVFPINKETNNDEFQEVYEEVEQAGNINLLDDFEETESIFEVKMPKFTYSRFINTKFKQLKRKRGMHDVKVLEKKYRKGKNIDYPKLTITASTNTTYCKEYKRILEYCSSLKFSFSRSFHKEIIDVDEILKNWPITTNTNILLSEIEYNNILFQDNEEKEAFVNPFELSFTEEINESYNEPKPLSDNVKENNYNMGFGEGSDRVNQNLEVIDDISKVSAATLSDVKQPQPFLLSENYERITENNTLKQDQVNKIKQYLSFRQLRDKVRSFFKQTTIELSYSWMKKDENDDIFCSKYRKNYFTNYPFDLCRPDFIQPAPIETVVQVVQVGQLPVSAAAQNPVTCDPRVTQVSDASPSQCSVDNSPQDDSQMAIKTEYTELTTADLTLPLQEYTQHKQSISVENPDQSNLSVSNENIPIETEIKSVVKIELMEELPEVKEENREHFENNEYDPVENKSINNTEYAFDSNNSTVTNTTILQPDNDFQTIYHSSEKQSENETYTPHKQHNGAQEKTDQIAHAMNAAGITTTAETITNTTRAHALVNLLSQKLRQGTIGTGQSVSNSFTKTTAINAMALQQALAQILPPPLNQTNSSENNQQVNTQVTPQVLHIVQGKNASGSQITLVDNSPQSVISNQNATPVLHIVQNKSGPSVATSNGTATSQANTFSGLSLVDAGLQQGGNQLLHIVNTGSQKNSNATGQLLKRVNLLTNLTNVQGSNEQKMVQFVCKSADGKSIQLNAPHQRSMVLRLQPIESPNVNVQTTPPKPVENQDISSQANTSNSSPSKDNSVSQHEIKSRSVYEENYAKFIQNSSNKTTLSEKSTSLPKFNQAFGKPVFQEGNQKQNEISVNNGSEGECQSSDNTINIDHIGQISSPPLLLRKSPQTSQSQTSNLVQQLKQTIAPMNIQTMHGGVIYTRQIPVNIGGGQTINLITVPSTELIDESGQKQPGNQTEIEQSIIKIVPQTQTNSHTEISPEDGSSQISGSNEATNSQPQPVLTQMRIKLPMLSKNPQMVSGARVVRPSFFQIQRNVIGGANQPVYQQLVLTAAPPLGQQTIRLPQTQTNRQIKVPTESQSSTESQMSSSTLEQLREFDMVLEQVKERSTVQPSSSSTTFPKLHTPSSDTTDGGTVASSTSTETTQQVLYSIGNNPPLNVAYVNRKTTVTTPTTSTFARSPDSSGIIDSPTSTSHTQIPHTVTSETTQSDPPTQSKPAKVSTKSKSRPKASSNPPNTLKLNTVPPKTSTQKPLEDEQTTQRILYILAEYKEQVENSPDKDKPAPRRRSNPPSNPSGSSKRKKSSSSSRRPGVRDLSPIHGEDTCRTMGSEDSSCGTSQGDCNESCLESHSPQDSPRKVARKLTFEQEAPTPQPRPQPQRNVIVADGQTITVARGTAGKPTTAVLMPANYILPVSMVKGGQQIAIVTNRGPKLLTVGGEGGATNALLLQRLIGPAGLKPVLARPGVRHVRLPTAALHNLQAFNLATATTIQPPDSTASPAPGPTPPELIDTRATSSPWTDREAQDVKPERASSPEASEPWHLPSSGDTHDYSYEETVRTDNLDRTVLDQIPDRYSPDMEAQRIFDKMFDVESKKSYMGDSHDDSPRCAYDIDASDCDDKAYHQVVQKKDSSSHRQHRLTHVSAAALRHKYAILEHELRLQKSLSEECEDLGVDSPSASELFPEAELLFAASPAHDHTQDQGHHSHTPQPTLLSQSGIPQPDIDDQIATDQLLTRDINDDQQDLNLGLEDVGIVTVSEDGMQATIALDQEEFARSHPNTTFHSEPTDEGEVQPFTIAGLKGRHITSTIFHSNRVPATVLMTTPQTTVISQATPESSGQNVKYSDIDNMINSLPSGNTNNINLASVLVKEQGLTRFDNILSDSRELHLSNTASAIVHSAGNATQVIRRVCYDDDKRDTRFLMDEPDALIAGDDAKMIVEDSSRDATMESMAEDVDDDRSSPERHAELFWESNSASERSESRRPLDFSSDSEKCCKSPSYDETNSTDSSGVGTNMRLDSVIKEARGIERSGSADGSSADDTHPPLRTYPPKRLYHPMEGEMERSLSGKTRAGERSPDSLEVRRRASGRGVVKRGCHCCNGSPAPPRPKKSRQRKPTMDFTN